MNEFVTLLVAAAAGVVGLYALAHLALARPLGNPLFYAVTALEIVLLAVLVGGLVALPRTDREVDGVLFISYLVTVVIIPPVAVLWGIAEKSRWGTGVVVVAMVTVAVLTVRTLQIYQGTNV